MIKKKNVKEYVYLPKNLTPEVMNNIKRGITDWVETGIYTYNKADIINETDFTKTQKMVVSNESEQKLEPVGIRTWYELSDSESFRKAFNNNCIIENQKINDEQSKVIFQLINTYYEIETIDNQEITLTDRKSRINGGDFLPEQLVTKAWEIIDSYDLPYSKSEIGNYYTILEEYEEQQKKLVWNKVDEKTDYTDFKGHKIERTFSERKDFKGQDLYSVKLDGEELTFYGDNEEELPLYFTRNELDKKILEDTLWYGESMDKVSEYIQQKEYEELKNKETKKILDNGELLKSINYDYDDGDQFWPNYSKLYYNKEKNVFIIEKYDGYYNSSTYSVLTQKELLEREKKSHFKFWSNEKNEITDKKLSNFIEKTQLEPYSSEDFNKSIADEIEKIDREQAHERIMELQKELAKANETIKKQQEEISRQKTEINSQKSFLTKNVTITVPQYDANNQPVKDRNGKSVTVTLNCPHGINAALGKMAHTIAELKYENQQLRTQKTQNKTISQGKNISDDNGIDM